MRLSMFISRHTPDKLGDRIAWALAGMVCRFKPGIYGILRANLGQVIGFDSEKALNQTARQVFYTAVRSYYDLYRVMQLPREEAVATVELTESARQVTSWMRKRERGAVMVFPHLGNFDLGGLALAAHIPELQMLTLPDPPAGFQLSNELRERSGLLVTPLTPGALRQAMRTLRAGGVLGVAGDRPVSELDEPVPFFGRPARVPSGHVRLALKTDAVLVPGCCFLSFETKTYTIHLDPPRELIRSGDRDRDTRVNMRWVLDALEEIIRERLGQWQMFVPVWTERMEA
jgi:KDO2-lipid IV(A) lauroyltransferase